MNLDSSCRDAEICCNLNQYQPHVICIQETWLNKSVENISFPNYQVLSRRDRSETENRGGILTLIRQDATNAVHIFNSVDAECSWHFLHLDVGCIAFGNWYRPPGAEDIHITSLRAEMAEMKSEVLGFILIGDINIHHRRWLRYSHSIYSEGVLLKQTILQ